MDEFRTVISLSAASSKISLNNRILTFGSCFSDAIGERLATNKFSVLVNPFGTVYNPLALHNLIAGAVTDTAFRSLPNVRNDDTFLNYNFHSSFCALSGEELNRRIARALSTTRGWLEQADYLLITYGTAWGYILKETGQIVSNCHKMPSGLFEKQLLTVNDITSSFTTLFYALKQLRPELRVILTVSPVRHARDTLPLNSVSKSILRVACHELCEAHTDVTYFPAFEIMMDDLRDYRFYKNDMIHPTEQAEDYIWKAFTESYLDAGAQDFIRRWSEIRRAMNHKPFLPQSSGHKNFLQQLLKKLESLKEHVQVESEITSIKKQLDEV